MKISQKALFYKLADNFNNVNSDSKHTICLNLCIKIVDLRYENNLSIESIKATNAYVLFKDKILLQGNLLFQDGDEILQNLIDKANTYELYDSVLTL